MLNLDVSTNSTRIQDLPEIDLEKSDKINLHILTSNTSGQLGVTSLVDIKRLSKVSIDSLTDVLEPQTLIGSYNTDNYVPVTLDAGFVISDTGVLNFTMTYDTDLSGDISGTLMSPIINVNNLTYNKFTGFLQNTLTGRVSADSGNMETVLLGDSFYIDDNTLKMREQSQMNSSEITFETKTDSFVAFPAKEYTIDALFSINIILDNSFKNGDYFLLNLQSKYSVILKTSQENIVLERRQKKIYKFLYNDGILIDMLP
jgi:hypothetical protein